jgi:hypothetical protein
VPPLVGDAHCALLKDVLRVKVHEENQQQCEAHYDCNCQKMVAVLVAGTDGTHQQIDAQESNERLCQITHLFRGFQAGKNGRMCAEGKR